MAIPHDGWVQRRVTQWSDRSTVFALLADTWQEFDQDEGAERAAAIGYFSLISLFPLVVLLALGLTYFLGETTARLQVMLIVAQYIPAGLQMVDEIVVNVLENRGALSIIAILAASWGAIQIFRVLERAINRAWGAPYRRSFLRHLLFAVVMISTMSILTVISHIATAVFEFVRQADPTVFAWAPLRNRAIWLVVAAIPPYALSTALLALLYRYVPHDVDARWRDVLPPALVSALLWELSKLGFAFYVSNFARHSFNLLYGSIGTIIALLTWVYLTGFIILLGAHLCAVLARHRRAKEFSL
jgi:membrane protein